MALVTGGRLAAAVSKAGGLGLVGGAYAGTLGNEPDLRREMELAAGTHIGVGFITWTLAKAPQALDEALEHKPLCVYLSFGDPRPFAKRVHAGGAKLFCQVQCLRHVDEALDAGATAIVAQGTEAGGHGASRSTMPFVPEVADYLSRPLSGHAPARRRGDRGRPRPGRRADAGRGCCGRGHAFLGVGRGAHARRRSPIAPSGTRGTAPCARK